MKQRERGIAHVGMVIAILAVVTAIAFGGWYVWQKNKIDETSPTQTGNNQNQSKQEGDPSEGGKYLVIQEWGVRFELPEKLKDDVQYGLFTFKNGDQAIYFTSKKIAAKSTYDTCTLKPVDDSSGQGIYGGTIVVTRFKTQPDNPSAFYEASSDYWYSLEASNGGACYENDTGQEKGEFNSLIHTSINQIERIEQ